MKWLLASFLWLSLSAPLLAEQLSQTLAIRVHGGGAEATRLPEYDPGSPIAITVTAERQRLDTVMVIANGPNGEVIRAPLAHTADDRSVGTLALQEIGSWNLTVSSRAGGFTTQTLPLRLDVQAPADSNAGLVGLEVGTVTFIVLGGGGFLLLRRLLSVISTPHLERVA